MSQTEKKQTEGDTFKQPPPPTLPPADTGAGAAARTAVHGMNLEMPQDHIDLDGKPMKLQNKNVWPDGRYYPQIFPEHLSKYPELFNALEEGDQIFARPSGKEYFAYSKDQQDYAPFGSAHFPTNAHLIEVIRKQKPAEPVKK